MAKQKPGVYDRVLECAKDEFLSKGFLDASLRAIAQEAGTSTGSIYTRFGDKEGLFRAIVEPVVDEFRAMFREIQESFHQLDGETQKAEMGQYTAPSTCSASCWMEHTAPDFPVFWTSWWTLRWSTPTSTWRSSAARA